MSFQITWQFIFLPTGACRQVVDKSSTSRRQMPYPQPCPLCDKVCTTETSYWSHIVRCKKRMQDHTRHDAYATVNKLLGCKTEEALREKYKELTTDQKIRVYDCFKVLREERKALETKLNELDAYKKRTEKLNEKISKIPLDENENSFDLFGSESDSSPRSVDGAVQPAANTSLFNRVLSVVSSKSSSSSSSSSSQPAKKKRRSGSTLFDSFDTF